MDAAISFFGGLINQINTQSNEKKDVSSWDTSLFLPDELVRHICLNASHPNTLLVCLRVCKLWNQIASEPEVWRRVANNMSFKYRDCRSLEPSEQESGFITGFYMIGHDLVQQKANERLSKDPVNFIKQELTLRHQLKIPEFNGHKKELIKYCSRDTLEELRDLDYGNLGIMRFFNAKEIRNFEDEKAKEIRDLKKVIRNLEIDKMFELNITKPFPTIETEGRLIFVYPQESSEYKKIMFLKFKPNKVSTDIECSYYQQNKLDHKVSCVSFSRETKWFDPFGRVVANTIEQEKKKFYQTQS